MAHELDPQRFMMLGLLEDSPPAVKEHYRRFKDHLQIATDQAMSMGGVGSDAFGGLIIAANLFLCDLIKRTDM